jgi:hypothetical protein
MLIGRAHGQGVEYAWVRPGAFQLEASPNLPGSQKGRKRTDDDAGSSLPARSRWVQFQSDASSIEKGEAQLESLAGTLSRINCWLKLSAPPSKISFPYHLVITEACQPPDADSPKVTIGDGRWYGLALKANRSDLKGFVDRRKIYVFVVDGDGNGTPLFPSIEMGDVENIFPNASDWSEDGYLTLKQLGPPKLFQIGEPFGTDTYILLTISPKDSIDLASLSWTGVREPVERRGAKNPIDYLLRAVGTRAPKPATPASWSMERVEVASKPKAEKEPGT